MAHYPYLKQISFVILGLAEQGHTQEEIRAMAKEQMVRDMNDNAYSPSHVDKLYKELVSLKLIEKKDLLFVGIVESQYQQQQMGAVTSAIQGSPVLIVENVIAKNLELKSIKNDS